MREIKTRFCLAGKEECVYCFTQRYALAFRAIPQAMKSNFTGSIKVVKYIKASALNAWLYTALCHESDAAFTTLLLHTGGRKMVVQIFELRIEVKKFLESNN